MFRSVHLFPHGRGGYTKGLYGPHQLPAMDHARYVKMRLNQVDPRFRDPTVTYTFAAVDNKSSSNCIARAPAPPPTAASRTQEKGSCSGWTRPPERSGMQKTVAQPLGSARRTTSSAFGRKLPPMLLRGGNSQWRRRLQALSSQRRRGLRPVPPLPPCPPEDNSACWRGRETSNATGPRENHTSDSVADPWCSSFWAVKLKKLLAMVETLRKPDLFLTKTCHQGSDNMKALLDFLGCPHQE